MLRCICAVSFCAHFCNTYGLKNGSHLINHAAGQEFWCFKFLAMEYEMREYCGSGCMCAFEAHGWGWPPSKWSLGEAGMHHHHVIEQGWSLEWSSLDKSSLVRDHRRRVCRARATDDGTSSSPVTVCASGHVAALESLCLCWCWWQR